MFLPVFEADASRPRWPWLCLALSAAWLAAFAAEAWGGVAVSERFALQPGAVALPGALGFFLLHANPVHLGVSLGLLALVGPALEDRWGRIFTACALVLGIGGGAAATLHFAAGTRPLVGAAAAVTGLVGAATLRFRARGLTLRLGFGRRASLDLRLPALLLPVLWLAGAVWVRASEAAGGATAGLDLRIHAGAALAGAGLAATVSALGLESRWLRRRRHAAREKAIENRLAQARAEREADRPEVAFELLERALASDPSPRLLLALVETGAACGRRGDALARAVRYVSDAWHTDRRDDAARVWCQLVREEPDLRLDMRLRLALAPVLAAAGHRREAALTLRGELRSAGRDVSPGAAVRIAEAARTVSPQTAIEAARVALASDALDAGKRARIEALIDALETDPNRLVAPTLDAADDDPLRGAHDDDPLSGTDESAAPDPHALALPETAEALDLDAPAVADPARDAEVEDPRALVLDPGDSLDSGDSQDPAAADPILDDAELAALAAGSDEHRYASRKVIEAVPRSLGDGFLRLVMPGGGESSLALARIQALALVAVCGIDEPGSDRPIWVLDLLLNWNEPGDDPLKIARLRSDRVAPGGADSGDAAREKLRQLAATLAARSGASLLAAAATPPVYESLDAYERELLRVGA